MDKSTRHVPISLTKFSTLDDEFDSIRTRFDEEMRKMKEDMNRHRDEMLQRPLPSSSFSGSRSVQSSSRSVTSESRKVINGTEFYDKKSSVESSSTATTDHQPAAGNVDFMPGGLGTHRSWLSGLDSNLADDISHSEGFKDQKELKLKFDVSQYSPEEIMVKTVDNKLLVHARHEENKEGRSVFREYNREFLLPPGTDPETIRSSLSKDGILTVEAPLPQPAITHD